MKKKLLSMLLCAACLLAALPCALASDISGHWAESYITYLSDREIYRASATTGDYEPDRNMTRAEFMRYINRAFHFTAVADINYEDVKSNSWYYETVRIAEYYGYINGMGDGKMNPEGEVTREQALTIIGRLFRINTGSVTPDDLSFSDKAQVSTWSAGYIDAAVKGGFIAGYSDDTFQPKKIVTRGEVAKILYGYLGTSLDGADVQYTQASLKTDTNNVSIVTNCTLTGAMVPGDLYITEGVGNGAVVLQDVTVQGSIILAGGNVTLNRVSCDRILRV